MRQFISDCRSNNRPFATAGYMLTDGDIISIGGHRGETVDHRRAGQRMRRWKERRNKAAIGRKPKLEIFTV